jgi:hypothetical protein
MLSYSKTADLGGFILPRDLATVQKATVDTISEPFDAKDLIPSETEGKKNEDGKKYDRKFNSLLVVQYNSGSFFTTVSFVFTTDSALVYLRDPDSRIKMKYF